MKTIGIAGGIGSGKSVVSRILRLRGECVYDCDLEARRIMDESEEILSALNKRFGDEVCPAGGPIDRKTLARHVFSSNDNRLWLNAMVHRLVRDDISEWQKRQNESGAMRCFVESAILATSGLTDLCDEVWLVTASDDVRIARVINRDSITAESIRHRIRAQQQEEKLIRDSGIPIRQICNDPDNALLDQLER